MTIVSSAPLSTGFRLPQTVVEVKFSNRATKWQGDGEIKRMQTELGIE